MSSSGISWAICKSAPRSRQITTPAPHHSIFYRPDALPAAQPTVSKHWRHEHWRHVSPPNQQIHWMQNGSDESGICTARCIPVAQPAVSENRTALMPTRESHSLIYQLMMIWMLHALYELCINTALAWSMSQIWLPHIYYQPQLATRSNPNNKNLTTNAKAVCIGLHSICSSSQTFVLKISEKATNIVKKIIFKHWNSGPEYVDDDMASGMKGWLSGDNRIGTGWTIFESYKTKPSVNEM